MLNDEGRGSKILQIYLQNMGVREIVDTITVASGFLSTHCKLASCLTTGVQDLQGFLGWQISLMRPISRKGRLDLNARIALRLTTADVKKLQNFSPVSSSNHWLGLHQTHDIMCFLLPTKFCIFNNTTPRTAFSTWIKIQTVSYIRHKLNGKCVDTSWHLLLLANITLNDVGSGSNILQTLTEHGSNDRRAHARLSQLSITPTRNCTRDFLPLGKLMI